MNARATISAAAMAFCISAAMAGSDDATEHSHAIIGLSPAEPIPVTQGEIWKVHGGLTTISLRAETTDGWALAAGVADEERANLRELAIMRDSTLSFTVKGGSVEEMRHGRLVHLGDLAIRTPNGAHVLTDLVIGTTPGTPIGSPWIAASRAGEQGLMLDRVKAGFDATSRTLTVRSDELRVSAALATRLGVPEMAGTVIGSVTIRASADWIGGAKPDARSHKEPVAPESFAPDGPDMTFCQLYYLQHLSGSRLGDIVGLSVATTSWNIGTRDMMWFNIPDEEHPFIVMNMFRLKDDRLEQIGESCIKHGFYALGNHQCGGPPCEFEPGHGPGDWLGTGCTDTYGSNLNGVQSGMGPRYEVNPWTGYWYYPGSHMQGSHNHDPIEHRIQVHDGDLDPAQNPGATYFVEGYYVCLDDVDVMNSASWKEATVSGSPGGQWSLSVSGASTYPEIGFAIDAWPGATMTMVAEEIPVVEFQSPDGRCILAAKATQLDPTTWHYEYAMYNVDMDRQVGSFSVPIPSGTVVTNVGFHAVEHHDEPFNTADPDAQPIDNEPWTSEVTADAVTWSTATNPLRWGMLFNFRFDAEAPPADVGATVGLFRDGTPTELPAITTGPQSGCPADISGDGTVDVVDLLALLAAWGNTSGLEDINGDGIVDVLDLLELLSSWGPC